MKRKIFIEYDEPKSYRWCIVGEEGAIDVWMQYLPKDSPQYSGYNFYGGIEVHKRTPFYYSEKEPHHKNCWLLGGPCWHDGSSLQFEEQVAPHIATFGPEKAAEFCFTIATEYYHHHFPKETKE